MVEWLTREPSERSTSLMVRWWDCKLFQQLTGSLYAGARTIRGSCTPGWFSLIGIAKFWRFAGKLGECGPMIIDPIHGTGCEFCTSFEPFEVVGEH